MQDLFDVSKIEERRRAIRVPIGDFCRQSGLNPATWERLRSGAEPRLSTARAIKETIEGEERRILAYLISLHPDHAAELLGRGKVDGAAAPDHDGAEVAA